MVVRRVGFASSAAQCPLSDEDFADVISKQYRRSRAGCGRLCLAARGVGFGCAGRMGGGVGDRAAAYSRSCRTAAALSRARRGWTGRAPDRLPDGVGACCADPHQQCLPRAPLVVVAASLARAGEGAALAGAAVPVRFGGKASVTLAPGQSSKAIRWRSTWRPGDLMRSASKWGKPADDGLAPRVEPVQLRVCTR